VLSDSRSPKNVQCIRAGEAIVVVNMYKNGNVESQERLKIYPTSIQENDIKLLSTKLSNTTAISLLPYPNGVNKVELSNYCLELTVHSNYSPKRKSLILNLGLYSSLRI